MAHNKQFQVPPVVFKSGADPVTGGAGYPQRRVAMAPFQPPRSSSSSIPFMSFDVGSATASTSSGPIYGGPIGAGASANFDDEEPLLDELGIHPDQIWKKIRSILIPYRINYLVHKDSDLSGPILLYMSFCLFQLLAGKIQFGVILGWIVVSSIFLYVVFNMLAGRSGNLDLHTCTSVVGYCMLPLVILSALSLFLPLVGMFGFGIATIFSLWATRASTTLLVALADGGDEHRGLIAGSNRGFAPDIVMDEEEDLFEIDLEVVNCLPPSDYWVSYCACSCRNKALLANCLLPISDLSSAVPISLEGTTSIFLITEPVPMGTCLKLPFISGLLDLDARE